MENKSHLGMLAPTKQLLGDEVFRILSAAITSGSYEPGRRLRDGEIAAELHVSRMPVREAFQRLERIGLIEALPHRLTRVTFVTEEVVMMSLRYAGYQAAFAAHEGVPRMAEAERIRAAELVDAVLAQGDDARAASTARRDLFAYLSAIWRSSSRETWLYFLQQRLRRSAIRVRMRVCVKRSSSPMAQPPRMPYVNFTASPVDPVPSPPRARSLSYATRRRGGVRFRQSDIMCIISYYPIDHLACDDALRAHVGRQVFAGQS
jgi:DNA-binding GntR family transcriptional regulator